MTLYLPLLQNPCFYDSFAVKAAGQTLITSVEKVCIIFASYDFLIFRNLKMVISCRWFSTISCNTFTPSFLNTFFSKKNALLLTCLCCLEWCFRHFDQYIDPIWWKNKKKCIQNHRPNQFSIKNTNEESIRIDFDPLNTKAFVSFLYDAEALNFSLYFFRGCVN